MAEEKKIEKAEEKPATAETVAKADYDTLSNEYRRVVAAYNRLLGLVANEYADKVSRSIFEEIDKSAK